MEGISADQKLRATTVVCVRSNGQTAIGADGQVTLGNTILKGSARKIRRLYNNRVLAGFAGSTSDALSLFERFESMLEKYQGNLQRSAVELGKDWRTDKILRRLEAMLLVADNEEILLISGAGDVISPESDIMAIGSGGNYALAAGISMIKHSDLKAQEIVEESLKVAASLCIYTNDQIACEVLEC